MAKKGEGMPIAGNLPGTIDPLDNRWVKKLPADHSLNELTKTER
jgi:hypothetical protein